MDKKIQTSALLVIRRPQIGLADLALSLKQLAAASPEDIDSIMNCLGFNAKIETRQWQPYRPKQAAISHPRYKKSAKPKTTKPMPKAARHQLPPVDQAAPVLSNPPNTTELETLADTDNPVHMPLFDNMQTLDTPRLKPLPRKQLIPRSKVRAILSSTVATTVAGRDPDIPRIIHNVVHCDYSRQLPCLPRRTTSHGCHVLLDFSNAMMPWWQDLKELKTQLKSLMGENCYFYTFKEHPAQASRWTEKGESLWQAVPGIPIIVASDLGVLSYPGLEQRSQKHHWQKLALQCRKRQAPMAVLNPLHETRWPRGLDPWLRLIPWRGSTTATAIKQLQTLLEETR